MNPNSLPMQMTFEDFEDALNSLNEEEKQNVTQLFISCEEKLKEAAVLHQSAITFLKQKLNGNRRNNSTMGAEVSDAS